MIVGIDAGTTTAIAVLDFNGKLVYLNSWRSKSIGFLINKLQNFSPSVIATDTRPPSKLVKKLKSNFKCRLFVPIHSLSIGEKNKLAHGKNAHERDALAAAIKAFHSLQGKIRNVRKRLNSSSTDAEAKIIAGRRLSK